MEDIFNSFDDDQSGNIGPDEFRALCNHLEPDMEGEMIDAALRELDLGAHIEAPLNRLPFRNAVTAE
eukprot:SAG11_NODE_5768_length_1467_cov_1.254386_2_plen_67_part_00